MAIRLELEDGWRNSINYNKICIIVTEVLDFSHDEYKHDWSHTIRLPNGKIIIKCAPHLIVELGNIK